MDDVGPTDIDDPSSTKMIGQSVLTAKGHRQTEQQNVVIVTETGAVDRCGTAVSLIIRRTQPTRVWRPTTDAIPSSSARQSRYDVASGWAHRLAQANQSTEKMTSLVSQVMASGQAQLSTAPK